MTKVLRRFITVSSALAALGGCGVAPDAVGTGAASSDAHTIPAAVPERSTASLTPTSHEVGQRASRRLSRSLSRTSFTEDGELRLDVATTPAVAGRPAVRVDPPAADLEAAGDDDTVVIDQVWLDLAECESNQRWDYNGSSGYDGGLQFSPSTWRAVDGTDFTEYAWQATAFEQVAVAERLLDLQGWGAWPACSRELGLR